MAASSVKWLIKEELMRVLQGTAFNAQDGDDTLPIKPASVVFRKVSYSKPENEGWPQEDMPGLIISTPRMTTQDIEGGECARDRWNHKFLIQIIDGDRSPDLNVNTYWKWQEQICDLLNFQTFLGIIPEEVGCLFLIVVTMVDDIDEKVWQRHPKFVSGVEAHFIVLKNREVP